MTTSRIASLALVALASLSLTGCASPSPTPLIQVSVAEEMNASEFAQLALADGWVGNPNDGVEALYVPLGTVYHVADGTWTVTELGAQRCVDGTDGECTGREFLPTS